MTSLGEPEVEAEAGAAMQQACKPFQPHTKLAAIGIDENERNLRNMVSRGKFTTGFLLQCLPALGANEMRL